MQNGGGAPALQSPAGRGTDRHGQAPPHLIYLLLAVDHTLLALYLPTRQADRATPPYLLRPSSLRRLCQPPSSAHPRRSVPGGCGRTTQLHHPRLPPDGSQRRLVQALAIADTSSPRHDNYSSSIISNIISMPTSIY
ncbi:hypothetical protein FH972_022800 [Carpinus fangiana]|uniref:Uncharacterized protein n=1 Tax=Carpinus fangiana TaxID=176857 RepID=A0A5N6KTL7_9ROSI|nr:hypothetical protein FH972_022800 [Carpinus fangiana]